MKRILAAVAATLGLLVSAGQATASGPADSALQLAGQAAAAAQAAGAQSGAGQSQPANENISVRVQSPGGNGNVTQSNSVTSGATAANGNLTGQSADQSQGAACACGVGTQAVGQEADSKQSAAALSAATQQGASNENIAVRVQSPGDDGSVSQSNAAASTATAGNANATGQTADQTSAGGSGTQAIGQEADSEQKAAAASKAEQAGAKNTNISVRVQSRGDDGDVAQTNRVDSSAKAANLNLTGQGADQGQAGSGTQAIGQDAKSHQTAAALSSAEQKGAANTNTAVRVQSPGDAGDVSQENAVSSAATAANLNGTKQHADQAQAGRGCPCGSGGTQAVGQDAKNEQGALALSAATQSGASNTNTPVRVQSKGDDGDVSQANSVSSAATAGNLNGLKQDAEQGQAGGCPCGSGTQAIGQEAKNEQAAAAESLALQQAAGKDRCGCTSGGNGNSPVRVDSDGHGGSVEQSSSVDSTAKAANLNLTGQDADQQQAGSGTQAIGQEAKNDQAAIGLSGAFQYGASNSNVPVRVDSKGDGGDVSQSNRVRSDADALNVNLTKQGADQAQGGRDACGCSGTGIQAIGQEAKSEQGALAVSLAAQLGASNDNAPVQVDSYGNGGSVEQSNSVDSRATAANLNALKQDAHQQQAGRGGTAIQALGQAASNRQAALGFSGALQLGASNESTPVLVDSHGGGGSVAQSNSVGSDAKALNGNLTGQAATQRQASSCPCQSTRAIQALGQDAANAQFASGGSLALQCGSRRSAPVFPRAARVEATPDKRGWRDC